MYVFLHAYSTWKIRRKKLNLGWLVGWLFWVLRPFETVFQSISRRLPKRGRKRNERTDESKMSKQPPPAPTASAVGPCPTVIQIIGHPGTGSLHSTIAPPEHPLLTSYILNFNFKSNIIIQNNTT